LFGLIRPLFLGTETPEDAAKVEWHINSAILNKLLIALNECSEWGRVAILTQLARSASFSSIVHCADSFELVRYKAIDERESEHICERVVPQLQHANGSVVLSAVKVRIQSIIGTFFLIYGDR
jgi:AP-1 complex subunit beta-1